MGAASRRLIPVLSWNCLVSDREVREPEDWEPENCFSSQVGKRVVRAITSRFAEVFGTQIGSGEVVDCSASSLLAGETIIKKVCFPKMSL